MYGQGYIGGNGKRAWECGGRDFLVSGHACPDEGACGRSGLVPEGSTVLVKASHDMGFGEVLKFLRERAEEEIFIKS